MNQKHHLVKFFDKNCKFLNNSKVQISVMYGGKECYNSTKLNTLYVSEDDVFVSFYIRSKTMKVGVQNTEG